MLRNLALLGGLFAVTAWLPATGRPGGATRPAQAPPGWVTAAPRDELRPAFAFEPAGGADGKGAWVIRAGRREGQHGWWSRTYPVVGGKHYRFSASYQAAGVAVERRSVVARVLWQDDR